jgi:hypothetical protein
VPSAGEFFTILYRPTFTLSKLATLIKNSVSQRELQSLKTSCRTGFAPRTLRRVCRSIRNLGAVYFSGAKGWIAGVLPGTGGRVAIDEPQSSSDVMAEEATVPSRSVQLPPWSVHLLVPGLVLVSGSLGFFRSSSKGTMGLVILAMAVVTGLICSGALVLYERLFGAIKD